MNDIQRVKDRIDIANVIGRYVQLVRSGSNFKACCPFHEEKTPSFFVSTEKQFWHCYGACGTGGDVLSFLMKKENLEFYEALKRLAAEAGIELQTRKKRPRTDPHATLHTLMAQAAAFYRRNLLEDRRAGEARAYVARRGIAAEVADQFGLGCSLWQLPTHLCDFMVEQGFALDDLAKVGLLYHDAETNAYRDRFRGRLMIPIRNLRGQVIGFGARTLDAASRYGPKYTNSPTTPLFQKSGALFGIDRAAESIRRQNQAVLVEGYLDVITAHQHGFTNTVACMGTAVTPDQLHILRRLTSQIVFALDADTAGQQATMRGLARARQALGPDPQTDRQRQRGLSLSIVTLPAGQDPDDLIRTDRTQWAQLVADAIALVDFYIQYVARHFDLAQPDRKQAAMEMLAEVLVDVAITRPVALDAHIQRIGREFHTPHEILQTLVNQAHARRQQPSQPEPAPVAGPRAETQTAALPREEILLGILLLNPLVLVSNVDRMLAHLAQEAQAVLRPLQVNDFSRAENRALFQSLTPILASGQTWNPQAFADALDEPLQTHCQHLVRVTAPLQANTYREASRAALENLLKLRREAAQTRIRMFSHHTENADMAEAGGPVHWRRICYQERQHMDLALQKMHLPRHHMTVV